MLLLKSKCCEIQLWVLFYFQSCFKALKITFLRWFLKMKKYKQQCCCNVYTQSVNATTTVLRVCNTWRRNVLSGSPFSERYFSFNKTVQNLSMICDHGISIFWMHLKQIGTCVKLNAAYKLSRSNVCNCSLKRYEDHHYCTWMDAIKNLHNNAICNLFVFDINHKNIFWR